MSAKWASPLVVISMVFMQVQPALAALAAPADSAIERAPLEAPADSAAPRTRVAAPAAAAEVSACARLGREDGRRVSTGGAFAIGVGCGVVLFPLGMPIAWLAQGTPRPCPSLARADSAAACHAAYARAFGSTGRQRKRYAALAGSAIGTALVVGIGLYALSHSSMGPEGSW